MIKPVIVAGICLSVLCACSNHQKNITIIDSVVSEGISISEIVSSTETELEGIKPVSYKLDSNEIIRVYDFGSIDNRERGQKQFQQNQMLLSSHAPIVYQVSQYMVLYYSKVNSKTQTPALSETRYGVTIQKAIKRIQ